VTNDTLDRETMRGSKQLKCGHVTKVCKGSQCPHRSDLGCFLCLIYQPSSRFKLTKFFYTDICCIITFTLDFLLALFFRFVKFGIQRRLFVYLLLLQQINRFGSTCHWDLERRLHVVVVVVQICKYGTCTNFEDNMTLIMDRLGEL